jgi:hypothetical protein
MDLQHNISDADFNFCVLFLHNHGKIKNNKLFTSQSIWFPDSNDFLILKFPNMFEWTTNSRIAVVFGRELTVMYSNVNLLFRNSENSCYSMMMM